MEKQGSAGFFGGPDFDSQVLVPITTFSKIFGGRYRDFNLAVKAPPGADLADFEYELVGEMRKIRRLEPGADDNFAINKMDSLLDAFNNVMGTLLLIGMSVTGISLFVGAMGILTIMWISVHERTAEIGLLKAVGARSRQILAVFLAEAALLSTAGGLLGLELDVEAGEVLAVVEVLEVEGLVPVRPLDLPPDSRAELRFGVASARQNVHHTDRARAVTRHARVRDSHLTAHSRVLSEVEHTAIPGAGSCGAFQTLEDGLPSRPGGFCNVNQLFELPTELAESISENGLLQPTILNFIQDMTVN